MEFTTLKFLAFLAAIAVLCRVSAGRHRALLLLASSYAFYYSSGAGKMILLLIGATVASYLAARGIEAATSDNAKRGVMLTVVAALIAVLTLFKSASFLEGVLAHGLIMPLGISYYTFRLISYVVDVYWGKVAAEKAFIPFAAYVAFFPQIVAGPIQRCETFFAQIHQPVRVGSDMFIAGTQRILLGYFKKFVVADNLALLVNFVYGHLHDTGTPLIVGYYLYPLQMYADFSGLTDIAIGAGYLLGVQAPENFNGPFWAASPSEYWRRWHITLTTWLTDYVFTPLRMSTRTLGDAGLMLCLLVNMVLIGVWHGFRWSFALFGVVHAIYLSADALTARMRKRYYKAHPRFDTLTNWVGPVVTFHLVAIAFVFFRGASVNDIFYFLNHLFYQTGLFSQTGASAAFSALVEENRTSILTGLIGYALIEMADYVRRRYRDHNIVGTLPRWGRWSVYACTAATAAFAVLLMPGSEGNSNPFLYAIF
jgi:alginate O-acetyltransferase complex protein AlgI